MTEPTYTPAVLRLRAACEHFLNLLDRPKPVDAWRRAVVDAWREIQEASSREEPREEELEKDA